MMLAVENVKVDRRQLIQSLRQVQCEIIPHIRWCRYGRKRQSFIGIFVVGCIGLRRNGR